jgi:transposase
MNEYKVVGIDLAKNVFQICALNRAGKVAFNQRLTRKKLASFIQQLPISDIAMEACGSANYWGRTFEGMGHRVRLIPAQYVKPFVKRQKNDANDALAICEAAQRPDIHAVPIKSIEQQDMQMIHRIRQRHVKNKTVIVNQIRAFLREYGIILPETIYQFKIRTAFVLEDQENGISVQARQMLKELFEEFKQQEEFIQSLEKKLHLYVKSDATCQRLMTIPGYGPIISTALVAAVGNAAQFKKGRQLSAWAGLTPRHVASGNKISVLNTSKAGNPYLRFLLIHGARTVVHWCHRKDDPLSRWIQRLVAKRGKAKAIVALANKSARIAWVILTKKETFRVSQSEPSA